MCRIAGGECAARPCLKSWRVAPPEGAAHGTPLMAAMIPVRTRSPLPECSAGVRRGAGSAVCGVQGPVTIGNHHTAFDCLCPLCHESGQDCVAVFRVPMRQDGSLFVFAQE